MRRFQLYSLPSCFLDTLLTQLRESPVLQVNGPSMLPTINIAGDVILAEFLSPRLGNLGHGDLVLVRSPLNLNRRLTKRIVAMEGDTVTYFNPLNADAAQTAVVCVLA